MLAGTAMQKFDVAEALDRLGLPADELRLSQPRKARIDPMAGRVGALPHSSSVLPVRRVTQPRPSLVW
jgi:hypothetical protein